MQRRTRKKLGFPPDWSTEDEWFADRLKGIPILEPLVIQFGATTVWRAAEACLGFPPTWAPSKNDVLKIREYILKMGVENV